MTEPLRPHTFSGPRGQRCLTCGRWPTHLIHSMCVNEPLARVLLERAQDGYVNPTGGKTTGRERKDGA